MLLLMIIGSIAYQKSAPSAMVDISVDMYIIMLCACHKKMAAHEVEPCLNNSGYDIRA